MLWSAVAHAAPPRVVTAVVSTEPRHASKAVAAAAVMQRAAARDPRFTAVDLDALATRDDADARAAKAEQARAAYAQAIDAFNQIEFPTAVARLAEAIALYEASDLTRGTFAPLTDALAMRAFVLFSNGDVDEARNELKRLFALQLDHPLDPRRITPEFQAVIDEVRAQVRALPAAPLTVQSLPVPALVSIDGVPRGVTPLTLPRIAGGTHYVTLHATGFKVEQGRHAGGGAPAQFKLESTDEGRVLRGKLEDLKSAVSRKTWGPAGAALASWGQAEYALVAGIEELDELLHLSAALVARDGRVVARRSQLFAFGGREAEDQVEALTQTLLDAL
ncbi:MAG: PEGA domain-containing protein, partial [Myxococcales bacterium]